jgi:signal transduction histidine kinase
MTKIRQKHGDLLLAVGFALAAVIEVWGRGAPDPAVLPLGALAALSLVWRVRAPLRVLGVNLAASLAIELITGPDDYPVTLGLILLVSIYSAAAHTLDRDETAAGGLLVASVPSLTAAHALDYNPLNDPSGRTNVFIGFVFLVITFRGAWLAGKWMQQRRAKQRALVAERAQQAREALRAERARIARELHDVLAHAISVIVLQARGARHALADQPQEARGAIDEIEQTAAQALGEMRRLLNVLRADDGGPELAPQPSLAQLEPLITHVRTAGLPVELQIEGTARELPPGVDLCAYRIVQEALTNSLKHAGPATAQVLLRYGNDAFEVEVADTGAGTVNGDVAGLGLAGMRERVALFGGHFESGTRPDGGYLVRARLPL